MGLTDRLIRDTEKTEDRRRRPFRDDDEEEETMTYQERRPIEYLNSDPGVFDSAFRRGINSDADVFAKTAVFRTKGQEGDSYAE